MNINIKETVGRNKNPDMQKWYRLKVKELAHFFANKAKNQIIFEDQPMPVDYKELEVIIK